MNDVKCHYCLSENVRTVSCHPYYSPNNIEIEEVECNECHKKTYVPLQNTTKQLRDNIDKLSKE